MKYHFYTDGKKKVICTTTFAKKMVKGVAVCADEDTFDLETGKKLAQARADYQFAKKRMAYANQKLDKAIELSKDAWNYAKDCGRYYSDCKDDLKRYEDVLLDLEESLGLWGGNRNGDCE